MAESNTVSIHIKAIDDFSNVIDNANKSVTNLSKNLGGAALAAGMIAAGTVGVKSLMSYAEQAAKAGDIQDAFNKRLGSDGPKALDAFKKATLGTVNKVDAMVAINQASARGIETENIPIFAKYAQQLIDSGQATGDVTDVMGQLTNAYIKNKDGLLKSFGVQFDATQALDAYARKIVEQEAAQRGVTLSTELMDKRTKDLVGSMTEAEKTTIQQKLALEAITKASAESAEPTKDFADSLQAIKAQGEELTTSIGQAMLPVFDLIGGVLERVIGWFNGLSEPMKQTIGIIIAVTSVVLLLTGGVIALTVAAGALNVALLPFIAIIIAVIAVITAVILIILHWKEILMNVVKFILDIVVVMIMAWEQFKDFWEILWANAKNIVIGIWNGILDFIQAAVNNVIDNLNRLIAMINKIPGINIPLIPKVDLGKFKGELTDINALMEKQKIERDKLKEGLEQAKGIIIKNIEDKIGFNANQQVAAEQPKEETTVNIENIYGTDPDEMSDALMEKLRKKTSLAQ